MASKTWRSVVLVIILLTSSCAIETTGAAGPAEAAQPDDPAALGLRGRLVYQKSVQDAGSVFMSIELLNLGTGKASSVFEGPAGGWIDSMSISPDGQRVIMAYAPPTAANDPTPQVQQDLYVLPLDGSAPPMLLFAPPAGRYLYLEPAWSPDGEYLYFCRLDLSSADFFLGRFGTYQVFRMIYPDGSPEKIADNAYWPRISPDGKWLVYVTADPKNQSNQLWLSHPDGSGASRVQLTGSHVPSVIDAPLFTADGRLILFSGTIPTWPREPDLAEQLLGILVASAHTIPSDWWSVSVAGGAPARLTHLAARGLFGSLSVDGKRVASYSNNGIFMMNLDGSGLTRLIRDAGGLTGTVQWIP